MANELVESCNKINFTKTLERVKELQDEFNFRLITILNNCDESIICPIITTSCSPIKIQGTKINKESPIFLNIIRKQEIGICAEYVYSENSST